MKTLFLLLLSITAYGQQTINASAIALDATATGAVTRWMIGQSDGTSNLAAGIDASTTSIVVVSFQGAGASAALGIDGEIVQCTVRTGTTYTCARGQQGTTAATHASGAPVYQLKYKTLNQAGTALMQGQLRSIVRNDAAVQAAVAAAQAAAEATVTAGVQ